MSESHPLPSGGDSSADAVSWKSFVEELKQQWRILWRDRIDDKVIAEGISTKDFELLFIDRGTVIYATRCFTPINFREILEHYDAPYEVKVKEEVPHPSVGGWRKFGKGLALRRRKAEGRRRAQNWEKSEKKLQQLKKGGRGWLHTKGIRH